MTPCWDLRPAEHRVRRGRWPSLGGVQRHSAIGREQLFAATPVFYSGLGAGALLSSLGVPNRAVTYAVTPVTGPAVVWMVASLFFPLPAIAAAHVQMVRTNRRAIPRIRDVSVTPTRTERGGGLALRARF